MDIVVICTVYRFIQCTAEVHHELVGTVTASNNVSFNVSVFDYCNSTLGKGKGSPYSIIERRVPELIPVLGSQPAGDVNHKPRRPLLSARPAVTLATLNRAATNFAAW